MTKVVWAATVAALLFVCASGLHAQKVKRVPITPTRGVSGSVSYEAFCRQCHGVGGLGDGPVAKALKVPPADLTRIAQRHGGRFPADAVRQIIMAEQELLPHGNREMPVWGPPFRSVEDSAVVELRVRNLVRYLEGLQQK